LLFLLFFLLALPSLAWMNTTLVLQAPTNHSVSSGNVLVNLTFNGTGNVTISYNQSGAFVNLNSTYNVTNHAFTWETANGSFTDGVYGLRVLVVNASNHTDNATQYLANLSIDNTPPLVTNLTLSATSVQNDTTPVTFTVTVTDVHTIDTVVLSNGTSNSSFSVSGGNSTNAVYTISLNLTDVNCQDDAVCYLTVNANDSQGNTNDSLSTGLLYIDASPPFYLSNRTNVTSGDPGENITVSALWSDIALVNTSDFSVVFEYYTTSFGSHPNFATWTNALLTANYTNTTFVLNGSDEGTTITFRITLNDSQNRQNTTANLTVSVNNISPTIRVANYANTSYIESSNELSIEILDIGVGTNLSALIVNASSATLNRSVSYAQNSSYFSCSVSYSTSSMVENATCAVQISWLSEGNYTFALQASDDIGNRGNTSYEFSIVSTPDIVNLTINGQRLVNITNASVALNISNASKLVTFNWTVDTTVAINLTTIAFTNTTQDQATSRTDIPALVSYNLTAGKNLFRINVTLNNSALTDTFSFNLTANVPLNMTTLEDQYVSGMVSAWNVTSGGTYLTGDQFVNVTVDILVNVSNETNTVPFAMVLNYSGLDGLSLRWNATETAFGFETGGASLQSLLSSSTASNVTVVLQHMGETSLFFDEQEFLLVIHLNQTFDTVHYQDRNTSSGLTYLVQACSSVPTVAVTADAACFTTNGSTMTLYVPPFNKQDRLLLGGYDDRGPSVTIATGNLTQSIIPLDIQVVTPNPNTTFCSYTLAEWNGSVATTLESDTLSLTEFNLVRFIYQYEENITGYSDGEYNISVTCADNQSQTNITRKTISISDTTKPTVSSVSSSSIGSGSATITGSANEIVNFTVLYGTDADDLDLSKAGNTNSLTVSVGLTGLFASTRYFYNLSACDVQNNCNSTSGGYFSTSSSSSGGGGGGGGGGGEATTANTDSEATDSRVWSAIAAGSTIEYSPKNMIISNVKMTFANAVGRAMLTIRQYAANTEAVPEPLGNDVYRYFSIDHEGLDDVAYHEFSFTVEKSWSTGRDVGLWRYEEAWKPYDITKEAETTNSVTYNAIVPGFSWWAIGVEEAPVIATAPPVVDTIQDEVVEESSEPQTEQPSEFKSALPDPEGMHPAFLISGIVLLLVLLVIGGLKYYQVYQEQQTVHEKELGKDRRQIQEQRHGPLAELHIYLDQMRDAGHDKRYILERLKSVGWDEVVAHQEIEKAFNRSQ